MSIGDIGRALTWERGLRTAPGFFEVRVSMDRVMRIKTATPSRTDSRTPTTRRRSVLAFLPMLPGDHLYVHATITGKSVKRPYTPSSLPGTVVSSISL